MNRARLYSRGTTLAEIPPEFRGVTLLEWERMEWDRMATEARASMDLAARATENAAALPVKTGRDGYGWRGKTAMNFKTGVIA